MKAHVVFLHGGIRRDALEEARAVLGAIETRFGHTFVVEEHAIGTAATARGLDPLSDGALEAAKSADAVWIDGFGASSGTYSPAQLRQRLRRTLQVSARVRPIRIFPAAVGAPGLDVLLMSEVDIDTGGLRTVEAEDAPEATRGAREQLALALARHRWGLVTQVNPEDSALEVHGSVRFERRRVESIEASLSQTPGGLDVVLAEGAVAERLAQFAAHLPRAVAPWTSAWMGEGGRGLFWANESTTPVSMALQLAFALRCSLRLESEAAAVDQAVASVLPHRAVSGEMIRAAVAGDALGSMAI